MKKIVFLLVGLAVLSSCSLKKNVQSDELDPTKPVKIATFVECQNLKDVERQACFKTHLDHHVIKHFNYPREAAEAGVEGKVLVTFKIMKDGSTLILNVHGGTEILQNEAKRIFAKLPKFIPAEQEGRKVNMSLAYPINFKLN